MAINFRKILEGLRIIPKTTSTASEAGDLDVTSGDGKLQYSNGTTASAVVTETHTATLTNKTLTSPVINTPTADTITGIAGGTLTVQSATNENLSLQAQGTGEVLVEAVGFSANTITGGTSTLTIQSDTNQDLSIQAQGTGAVTVSNTASITGTTTAPVAISSANNQDITISPNGAGNVVIDQVKISDNTISTSSGDLNLSPTSGSKAVVTTLGSGTIELTSSGTGKVIVTTAGNANIELTPNGTGVVDIDNLSLSDNTITTQSGDLNLTAVNNSNVSLNAAGTGQVRAEDPLHIAEQATPSTGPTVSSGYGAFYSGDDGFPYFKNDGGAVTQLGAGSGGVNFVGLNTSWAPVNVNDRNAESSVGNWAAYKNSSPSAIPDNGMTGGSPNTTITRTTTAGEILNGTASFKLTKSSGASRQGEGVSCVFNVPVAYQGKNATISIPFKVVSGSVVDGDFKVFIYDVTNSQIITPFNNSIVGTLGTLVATFPVTSPASTPANIQMRVGIHVASTTDSSVVIAFDDVSVGPETTAYGMLTRSPQLAGFIQEFGGTTDPEGWLICDGRSFNRATYPQLFANIGTAFGSSSGTTFNIPDFRGRFLRGVDGTAGLDPDKASRTAMNAGGATGNNVGSVQADDYLAHSHGAISITGYVGVNPLSASTADFSFVGGSTGASGGNETRPKNAYVNFVIKLYNDVSNATMSESSTFKISSYLANGTRVTTTPSALGEYRSQLRNSSATTYTDTNGTPASLPNISDGIRIYASGAWASADSSNSPSRYEIFVGKNKNVTLRWFLNTGRTGFIDVTPGAYGSTRNGGFASNYDPTTGVLTVLSPSILGSSSTGASALGTLTNGDVQFGTSAYFDVIVSENALAVGITSPRSEIIVTTGAGHGSTATKIRRFSVTEKSVGNAITFSDDAAAGSTFTIKEDGIYSISYVDRYSAATAYVGISVNSTELTTDIPNITASDRVQLFVANTNQTQGPSATVILSAGDVIRAHTDGQPDNSGAQVRFIITKVSN